MTAVGDGEMLTEIRHPAASRALAARTRRSSAVPATGRSRPRRRRVWIDGGTIADAGLALSAVGPTTVHVSRAEELLRGQTALRGAVRPGGARSPPRTARRPPMAAGPVDYKRHLAGVLTQRALRRATARALHQEV